MPPLSNPGKAHPKGAGARIRRWFLAGLILLAPVWVTFAAVRFVFHTIDSPVRNALHNLTGLSIPGVGLLSTLVVILAVGFVASNFALKGVIHWFERTLDRIPLVRTLYSGVKQLLTPLADEHTSTFQTVVMIENPEASSYSLGFLIKRDCATSPKGDSLSAILLPTNHLHLGYVNLVPSSRIFSVEMSAEEGLKFLVSMGAALDRKLILGQHPSDRAP